MPELFLNTSTWATRPMVRDTPGMSAWSLSQLTINSAHPTISAKEIAAAAEKASASEIPTADSITLYIIVMVHICMHVQTFDSLYTFQQNCKNKKLSNTNKHQKGIKSSIYIAYTNLPLQNII